MREVLARARTDLTTILEEDNQRSPTL
jgi:hypothetical protein